MKKNPGYSVYGWMAFLLAMLAVVVYADTLTWTTLGSALNADATQPAYNPVLVGNPVDATGTTRLCAAWSENVVSSTTSRVQAKYWDNTTWRTLGGSINVNSSPITGSVCLATYPGMDRFGLFLAWDESGSSPPKNVYVKRWNGLGWDSADTGSPGPLNNNTGNNASNPSLAVYKDATTSTYYAYAIWQEKLASSNYQVFVKSWSTSNSWTNMSDWDSSNLFLNYNPNADAVDPKIGMGVNTTESDIYAFWREADGTGNYVLLADEASGGSPFGIFDYNPAGVTLNAVGTSVQHFDIAMDHGNPLYLYEEPIVTWAEGSTSTNQWTVRAARFTFTSNTVAAYAAKLIGGPINDQPLAKNPSVFVDANHVAYVAWEEQTSAAAPAIVKVKRFNGSAWEAVAGNLNIDATQYASHPSLVTFLNAPLSAAFAQQDSGGHQFVYVRSALQPAATPTPTPTVDLIRAFAGYGVGTFPQPATTQVNFALNLSQTGDFTIRVYNTRFRLVKEIKGTTATGQETVPWDVSGISPGIYFYELTIGTHKYPNQKLVIAR